MKTDYLDISYERLAQVVASTDMSGYETSFYISGPANSLHLMVVNAFSRYLIKDNEFDYCRAAALLDCDPALFSLNDVKLAVRAIWKSDRDGFYHGGRELYKSGWIVKLLLSLPNLQPVNANIPTYPSPSEARLDLVRVSLWHGYEGLWQPSNKSIYS